MDTTPKMGVLGTGTTQKGRGLKNLSCKKRGTFVAIDRYIRLLWATVVGCVYLYLWFTIGELRSPGNRVTP